ncbi:MAG: phosphoribosylformylglycinamidine synthase subunit PurS [Robiginitomaculum sp.]
MKARIHIGLKPGVLDPQGRTIKRSLAHLGFDGVSKARQGKTIDLDLDFDDKELAMRKVTQMCEKLLANTVIENYEIKIT